MILTPELRAELWYRARDAEIGITFEIIDPDESHTIRHMMYETRRELADESLHALSVKVTDDGKQLFIHKPSQAELT